MAYIDKDKERAFFAKRQKNRREQWRGAGVCLRCGKETDPPGSRFCNFHKEKNNEYRRKRHQRRLEQGLCTKCGNTKADTDMATCFSCRAKLDKQSRNAITKDWRRQIQTEVIIAYGGQCACCGETEPLFLEVDHIEDNGSQHRKTVKGGTPFYFWLKQQGYPKNNYRLLCRNCNYGRYRNGGICPHEEKRKATK